MRTSLKVERRVIATNEVPCLRMRSVGSHSTSGREKEGSKERTGSMGLAKPGIEPRKIYSYRRIHLKKDLKISP